MIAPDHGLMSTERLETIIGSELTRQNIGLIPTPAMAVADLPDSPNSANTNDVVHGRKMGSAAAAASAVESSESQNNDNCSMIIANDEHPETVVEAPPLECLASPTKRPRVYGGMNDVVIVDGPTMTAASAEKDDPIVDDFDSDVEVLTTAMIHSSQYSTNNGANNINKNNDDTDDDEIAVTSSNATNPNIDYPHSRNRCGIHSFCIISHPRSSNSDEINDENEINVKYCAKCYCYVCDAPASSCNRWMNDHCHSHGGDGMYVRMREVTLDRLGRGTSTTTSTSATATTTSNSNINQILGLVHNDFLSRLAAQGGGGGGNVGMPDAMNALQRVKERKEMRVTEVLLENFKRATILAASTSTASSVVAVNSNQSSNNNEDSKSKLSNNHLPQSSRPHQRMEGDIPTLSLYNSFFVEGIRIGWPFPEVMKPQRQMAIHLIKALKNSRHVVLESPTGTGKSAAILCSVLAWQRWHHLKIDSEKRHRSRSIEETMSGDMPAEFRKVKIIYCSRTHSQVAQMVASLKSTPYRPRMAILGSRDRLCIHKNIKPRTRGADAITGVNVNNECRLRVRNTEKSRRHHLTNPTSDTAYNDDDPPESMPGDGDTGGGTQDEEDEGYLHRSRTCPHYRQLTTSRVANLAHSTFIPSSKVDCCSVGGRQSKYGAHDIEDLVDFGVNPYIQKDIALYRKEPTESFGLSLRGEAGHKSGGGSFVRVVKRDTPADMNGSIMVGDKIIRVNGTDVSKSPPVTVVATIKGVHSDPLLLNVSRGGTGTLSSSLDDGYSSRSACPYYLSQILSKDAEIIFAPYNYVLDPGIRKALGLELGNSVVILDEAHNVESTLREAGSGKWGEFELCDLLVMLNNYAITERSSTNLIDVGQDGDMLSTDKPLETAYVCDVAHTLLTFVEIVVEKLRTDRTCFQNNPGKRGAANALVEWEKFHTQDDNEFEVTFVGPTGKGINGKCVGCLPFFEGLGITQIDLDGLVKQVEAFEKHVRGREGDGTTERDKIANPVERLIDLVVKLNAASQTPEHFYAAILATANGTLEFAKNGDVGESESGGRFKRKPRALPFIPPRNTSNPDRPANPCINPACRAKCIDVFNPIRHGECCNGSTPRWEAHLHLDLLTPGPLMQELSNECRTVVLASGSLAPIPSLCAELNLFPAADGQSPVKPSQPDTTNRPPKIQKRLQNQPTPLEAGHVVDLNQQLMAVSIGHFPDGSELRVAQKNYSQPEFLHKLGDCLVRIVEGIAEGGVLVFLPSYALLRKCERLWNPDGFCRQNSRRSWWQQEDESDDGPSVFDRLKAIKHNVIVEPSGDQDAFEEKRQEYMETVRTKGGCVLLAVFRGKMSEGISFNDNNARGVVCIGLPLPSAFALPIKVKMDYNEEQRKLRNRTDLLPGREWYNQQAYRAVAQALGRCIRHAADYGAIFLLDIRHCDDSSPNNGVPEAHKNLPKWMRHTVKNLSKHAAGNGNSMFNYVSSSNTVWGGWPGMKKELSRFFKQAKSHTDEVLVKQRDKIVAASKSNNVVHTYNVKTNKWSEEKSKVMPQAQPEISSAQENNYASKVISIDTTPNQTSRTKSTQANNPAFSNNGNSSRSSQSAKKGTLLEMFKKQHDDLGGSQKTPVSSSTTKSTRAKNTPNILKSMFEKQQVMATEASAVMTPTEEENMDVDDNEGAITEQSSPDAPQTKATTPMNNSFSFKRSPFANNTLTPSSEVASGTSELCLSGELQHQDTTEIGSPEEDERLCIVCEDAKKEVILLPCKHMCLCKKCASTCLFKTLHECPMCRAMIGDSMEVYW